MIKMNEENMIKIMEFNQVEQTIEILGHKIDKSYESWEAFLEEMKRLTLVQNNWNELNKLIDERIGDCRYFLANADVNYEKENMKKFMWLKEELQILKSKAQELEQGKDE